jgi:hypothetical protein
VNKLHLSFLDKIHISRCGAFKEYSVIWGITGYLEKLRYVDQELIREHFPE